MIQSFKDFTKHFKENKITILNKRFNHLIRYYSFYFLSSDLNVFKEDKFKQNNNNLSNILVIDYYEKSEDRFFIIGLINIIIFVDKFSIETLLSLFLDKQIFSICILPNAKKHFKYSFNFHFNEIKCDDIFQEEIQHFNENLSISSSNTRSDRIIWNIIKSCISGCLIKQGYQKLQKNRFNNIKNVKSIDTSIQIFEDDDYINLRSVGFGTINIAHLIYHIEKEEFFIIKEVNSSDQHIEILKGRELENYKILCHPLFPKFYGVTAKNRSFVIEFINGPTLERIELLNLTDNDRLTIIFEMMIAIQFIHSNNYVYRDLKPNNVIIDSNKTAVLVDFDRMVKFDENSNEEERTGDFNDLEFQAPEIFKRKYSFASDIFSLGKVSLYIMQERIQLKTFQELQKMCNKCINVNDKERPSISQLIFEFYINYHYCIQIDNVIELFESQLSKCFDNETFSSLKKLSANKNDSEKNFLIGLFYYNGKLIPSDVQKAFEYFKLAAEKNHPEAQFYLGTLYHNGKAIAKNLMEAKKLYELSANQDNDKALVMLGRLYHKGIVKDYKKAKYYFNKAIQLKNVEALMRLGQLYITKNKYSKGKFYYERAAEQGYIHAYYKIGMLYFYKKGVEQDYLKAKEYFDMAAEQNDPKALNMIGYMYDCEIGVKRDYDKAKEYFEKAVKLDLAVAHNNLGRILANGNGTPPDYLRAKLLFKKSSKLGNARGSFLLAGLYFNGHGIKQDFKKAIKYYKKAAELNFSPAICFLGDIYYKGLFVEKNYQIAKDYYEKASKFKDNRASFQLGIMYYYGLGVEQDFLKAKEYFFQSIKSNDLNSYYYLGELYKKGKGTEIDLDKSIELYAKCTSKQKDTVIIYYNQGSAHLYIINNKFYFAYNDLGLIYLFKYNDIMMAEKMLSKAGYTAFPFGKHNLGILNEFYLGNQQKADNLFGNAKENFTLTTFHLAQKDGKNNKIEESIKKYHHVIKYENELLEYNGNFIDDEQLHDSNTYIYCLSNLKLFQYYSNPQDGKFPHVFLINAIFRPLFGLLISQDQNSYLFKFVIDTKDKNLFLSNFKNFLLNFPFYGDKKLTEGNGWEIIKQKSNAKIIKIVIEHKNPNISLYDEITNNSDFIDFETKIKTIFEGINKNRNNSCKSIEIIDKFDINKEIKNKEIGNMQLQEDLLDKKNQVKSQVRVSSDTHNSCNTNNEKCHIKTCVISSYQDDIGRYLEYPECLEDLLIQSIPQTREIIDELIKDMMGNIYMKPYSILFGRIGEETTEIQNQKYHRIDNQKNIDSNFYDGFELNA